jgi:hypothetical protein
VHGIEIEFDAFSFELDKTTFPAVQDEGKADATATISACVQFGISTDTEKNIVIDNLEAHVRVDSLPVTVITANHKWLFNTLLSFFSSQVKDAVQEEVVEQVEKGVAYLDEQLGAALSKIIDTFASKGDELLQVAETAVDVSVLSRRVSATGMALLTVLRPTVPLNAVCYRRLCSTQNQSQKCQRESHNEKKKRL